VKLRPPHYLFFGLAAFLLLAALWVAVVYAFNRYHVSRYRAHLDTAARMMQQRVADDQASAEADIAGGKTPQESLSLYADALASKNYPLATTYFVGDRQQPVLSTLQQASEEVLESLAAQSRAAASEEGEFGADGRSYTVHAPILFHLIRYPNGVWKIVEW